MSNKILVSGADIDGISRGKYMNANKFKSISSSGFGFCNVIFAWGLHDEIYSPKTPIMKQAGFSDILAKVDESTKRICPISHVSHYLVDFYDPTTSKPLASCPRSLLKTILSAETRFKSMSGLEFEFYNFKETTNSLVTKDYSTLDPLTPGMFGYSLLRMAKNQDYIDEIYDKSLAYGIPLEAFHTETGPGVYEAILEYCEGLELADRAHLFKLLVKKIGMKYDIMPTFMAKPYTDKPGCSGHVHLSLINQDGSNAFYDEKDSRLISAVCRQFVAGVLKGLPSIMAILAPTINR
jgi:glutamine synthetase